MSIRRVIIKLIKLFCLIVFGGVRNNALDFSRRFSSPGVTLGYIYPSILFPSDGSLYSFRSVGRFLLLTIRPLACRQAA